MKTEKEKSILRTIIEGPSFGYTDNFPKREMWKEIANEMHGKFEIKFNSGSEIEIHEITIPHKKWNIRISISDCKPLKFKILFVSDFDFELIISWEDIVARIIKKFSKSEIELGWTEFDSHYLVKSNWSDLAKKIITIEIQETLLKHEVYSMSYQSDTKAGTAELISVIQRKAGTKDSVLELIDLFKLLIDNLENSRIIK